MEYVVFLQDPGGDGSAWTPLLELGYGWFILDFPQVVQTPKWQPDSPLVGLAQRRCAVFLGGGGESD